MNTLKMGLCVGIGMATLVVLAGVGGASAEDTAPPVTNATCPVTTTEPIDPNVWTDYEGQRVFFCCNGCKKQFLEAPEKYLAALPQFAGASQGDEDQAHAEEDETGEHHGEYAHAAPIAHAHDEDSGHDHATDHGEPQGIARLVRFLGKLHPVAVHFPIALAIAAFIAESLFFITLRGLYADAARFAIAAAAVTAIVTVAFGWSAGAFAHYPGDLAKVLLFHRWAGTSAGVLIVGTAILSELSHRRERSRALKTAYRCGLLLSVLAVGLAGHLGATLIYGNNHFAW